MTRLLTGLEISVSSARMVQICRERQGWRLVRRVDIPFAPGTLDVSNKLKNIQDPDQFLQAVRWALKSMEGKVTRVGISLPSEIVKIAVHTWDELPKSREKIHEMIVWKEKDLLPFPMEEARTAFFHLNGMRPGKHSLLVAVGSREIIGDYEMRLRSLRLEPEVVHPSAINHLNFYSGSLPDSGVVGFLSVLEDYFAFLVFEEKHLIFYRGKRIHATPARFLQEVAMTVQLYDDENSGKSIGTLFVQSQSPLPGHFYAGLSRECVFETISLDEGLMIASGADLTGKTGSMPIASYASAIGAAQSLTAY
jgi:type IV pilus assembly protein PilM